MFSSRRLVIVSIRSSAHPCGAAATAATTAAEHRVGGGHDHRFASNLRNFVPPRALNASVGAVSLRVAVVHKVRRRVLDVKDRGHGSSRGRQMGLPARSMVTCLAHWNIR